jgi:4-amino-4-deoxy-L-arabinose transferase-like glycosyltransferase
MTPSARDRETPFWLRPLALTTIVLALLAGRAWIAIATDLVGDEGYYTLWSLHPGPGYLDHPPGIAWAIALGRLVLGETELGVRAVALLTPLAISAALYRTAYLLCDQTTAGVAVLWYNFSAGVALSFLSTPDVPSTLFWMLAIWALAEFMRSRNADWWLAAGLLAGLGVMGKYTNLFLGLGFVLFILASRERREWLGLPKVWAGGAIAVLAMAPNLLWNAQNGWATALFQGRRITSSAASDALGNFIELVAGQALFLGPFTLVFFVFGTLLYLFGPRRAERAGLALPVLSSLPALGYFLYHATHARVELNWLLPLWPMMALVAAWAAVRGIPRVPVLWQIGKAGFYGQLLFGVLLVGLVYAVSILHPPGLADHDRTRDMAGWAELRQEIEAYAETAGAGWIGTTEGYGHAGLLASYGKFTGARRPIVPIGDAGRFGFLPASERQGLVFPAVFVQASDAAGEPPPPPGLFGRHELLGVAARRFGSEVKAYFSVYAVSEPTAAFLAAIGE